MSVQPMYQRPSRDEIAAQVHATLPGGVTEDRTAGDPAGTTPPKTASDPLGNFSIHLRARLRALGKDPAWLQDTLSIKSPITITKAVNGTSVELGLAHRIAQAVSTRLTEMLMPYTCGTCEGQPPPGFTCQECGTEGTRQ